MIELTDIAYVRSGVADLYKAVEVRDRHRSGLELAVPAAAGSGAGQGMGTAHGPAGKLTFGPTHGTTASRWWKDGSGVIASGFSVVDEDALAAAETGSWSGLASRSAAATPSRRPVPASRRVHRIRRSVRQPAGTRLPAADSDPAGSVYPARRDHRVRPPVPGRPGRARGLPVLEHLLQRARVSDWLGDAACLIRIDPVHHKLAVFRGDGPGLCHLNFQVETIDDVFRNWHFLVDNGVEDIEMGPGRHPSPPRCSCTSSARRAVPTSTPTGSAGSPTTPLLAAAELRPGRAGLHRYVARPDAAGLDPAAAAGGTP